jgi:TatA/E family protein of Tat protein translocase
MSQIGLPESMVILIIIIILFGSRRIPAVAKDLGEGIWGFKTGLHGNDKQNHEDRRTEKR